MLRNYIRYFSVLLFVIQIQFEILNTKLVDKNPNSFTIAQQ